MKNKLSVNPLNLLLIPLALFGLFQLFTYSTDTDKEEEEHQVKISEEYKIFSFSPPKEISFAGEGVPLTEPEVYERLDREIHANTYFILIQYYILRKRIDGSLSLNQYLQQTIFLTILNI
ncbi:MAG: hypothetical protein JKY48_13695 [Flavobacteriales bacterium]|nr:hypothetical protein [Flavobacteriales bacterium]